MNIFIVEGFKRIRTIHITAAGLCLLRKCGNDYQYLLLKSPYEHERSWSSLKGYLTLRHDPESMTFLTK